MTRIITYSLCLGNSNSNAYYQAIASLADAWFVNATREAKDIIEKCREYRRLHNEVDRSDAEYAFELLVVSVLLREHGGEAANLPNWSIQALKKLLAVQSRWPKLEKYIKNLRGWVGWMSRRSRGTALGSCDISNLVSWLRANGEDGIAERLNQWMEYASTDRTLSQREFISRCLDLADDFSKTSQAVLGDYTDGVEQFLIETVPRYRHRYDARLISHTRLEYHLGMLGTEILNRSYRQRFLSAPHKVVILPPCMRAQPDGECKAVATPYGAKCQDCTPNCRVHQITKLGDKRGFEVFMIPDELRAFGKGEGQDGVGVVGVSCALTNWMGGWDTNTLGIPAQGVLLDYVGCSYHWDEKGFPTDTNINKLLEVLRN